MRCANWKRLRSGLSPVKNFLSGARCFAAAPSLSKEVFCSSSSKLLSRRYRRQTKMSLSREDWSGTASLDSTERYARQMKVEGNEKLKPAAMPKPPLSGGWARPSLSHCAIPLLCTKHISFCKGAKGCVLHIFTTKSRSISRRLACME